LLPLALIGGGPAALDDIYQHYPLASGVGTELPRLPHVRALWRKTHTVLARPPIEIGMTAFKYDTTCLVSFARKVEGASRRIYVKQMPLALVVDVKGRAVAGYRSHPMFQ
jgi:hypothetical protein